MISLTPYVAGVFGAICYGTATVLEQVTLKNKKNIESINPLGLLPSVKQSSYALGLFLDFAGWLFFLYAVRSLPLFLVQSFVALSIVVSAILDRYWLKHAVAYADKIAVVLVIMGVTLLSIVAKPGAATSVSDAFRYALIISPTVIGIIGAVLVKLQKSRLKSSAIAALAGLSFGAASIITRIIIFSQIDKQLNQTLLLASLLIDGLLAMVLLSIVLQRESVNHVNSIVLGSEVIVPSIIGIIFLGDGVRNNLWGVMVAGLSLVFVAALFTYSDVKPKRRSA
jgi:hypothetical protein